MSNDESPKTRQCLVVNEYRNAFLSQLNEIRCVNHLCDVTVVAQGREFRAHRAVLAASGGFFGGLLATDMKEKSENTFQLNEVDVDVVEDLLKFIYTGKIVITRDNAQALAIAADFLLLEQLKRPVDVFLAKHVLEYCPSITTDIVPLCLFASQYKCTSLQRRAIQLIKSNFESVVADSPDFLDLDTEVLQSIIASDDIKVSSEEVVVRAMINWVKHKEGRKGAFQDLFSNIRLCSLSEEFLESFLVNDPLILNPSCLKLVLRSMKARYMPVTPTSPNREHSRDCLDSYTDAILVFRQQKKYNRGPWCYVPLQDRWYELPTTRDFHRYGIPFYHQDEGVLYLVKNEQTEKIAINRYHLESQSWETMGFTTRPSLNYNVVCLNGVFYFIGGEKLASNGEIQPVDSIYFLDVAMPLPRFPRKHLTRVSTLNQGRVTPYVVTDERYVYVLGGYINSYTGSNTEPVCTDTVERYDPLTKTCENLSPMKYKSCHGQCTFSGNKIFVIHSDIAANEVYDISKDNWDEISQFPNCLSMGALTACDDKLYLVGTFTGSYGAIVYDTKQDKSWQYNESLMYCFSREWANNRPMCATVVRLPKQQLSSFKLLSPKPSPQV